MLNFVASSMQKLPRQQSWIVVSCLFAATLLFVVAFRFNKPSESLGSKNRNSILPPVILWAWERPEKLDFIDSQKIGVAFLAKTIYLRKDVVVSRPRLQPLTLTSGTRVIAVARIETDRRERPTLSALQLASAVREISELGNLPNVSAVQIDFDATVSERDFYRTLLKELRLQLPRSTLLSITALASWCEGDNWLDDLPIDEAVPMLFRMGVERKQFLSQLAAGDQFNSRHCQGSAGVSTDEPIAELPNVQRLYVFSPELWSPDAVKQTMETYQK